MRFANIIHSGTFWDRFEHMCLMSTPEFHEVAVAYSAADYTKTFSGWWPSAALSTLQFKGTSLLLAGVYQAFAAAAGQLVDMSDPSAYWSCLAASAAAVGLVGQQVRSSFTVDADRCAIYVCTQQ